MLPQEISCMAPQYGSRTTTLSLTTTEPRLQAIQTGQLATPLQNTASLSQESKQAPTPFVRSSGMRLLMSLALAVLSLLILPALIGPLLGLGAVPGLIGITVVCLTLLLINAIFAFAAGRARFRQDATALEAH